MSSIGRGRHRMPSSTAASARNIQLHLIAPLVVVVPATGRSVYGYGDTDLGLKLRPVQGTPGHSRVETFPIVEAPARDARTGTGGGGGGWTDVDGLHQHPWFLGSGAQRRLKRAVTTGGELFHDTAKDEASEAEAGFNPGWSSTSRSFNTSWCRPVVISGGRIYSEVASRDSSRVVGESYDHSTSYETPLPQRELHERAPFRAFARSPWTAARRASENGE